MIQESPALAMPIPLFSTHVLTGEARNSTHRSGLAPPFGLRKTLKAYLILLSKGDAAGCS
jgi:hypothetical protein